VNQQRDSQGTAERVEETKAMLSLGG